MKKLITAVAFACAAVVTQAATVSWGGTTTIMDADDAAGIGTISYYINGVLQGSSPYEIGGNGKVNYGTWTVTGGDTVKAIATVTNFGEGSDETGFKEWSMTVTDEWIMGWSDPETAANKLAGATNNGLALEDSLVSGAEANGYTAVVPEPTSGLLLLLGVAGLALKRKRA